MPAYSIGAIVEFYLVRHFDLLHMRLYVEQIWAFQVPLCDALDWQPRSVISDHIWPSPVNREQMLLGGSTIWSLG